MHHSEVGDIDPKLDLVFERTVDISPELIWQAWTVPKHVIKWFTPAPWITIDCEINLTPGGIFRTVMRSPEGQEIINIGCYLEIVENKKLVFTDALTPDFRPSLNPFFTGSIILVPQGKGTKYTAVVRHKNEEDRAKHNKMGFKEGWGKALEQLVDYMKGV